MIVNQITEPPFYLVGVFIHNLYVILRLSRRRLARVHAALALARAQYTRISSSTPRMVP